VSSHIPADVLPECEYIPSSNFETFTPVRHVDHRGIMHIIVLYGRTLIVYTLLSPRNITGSSTNSDLLLSVHRKVSLASFCADDSSFTSV